MATNIHFNTNVKGKIEIDFLSWYSSHFADKFLSVYRLNYSSFVMTIFFPNTLTTFHIFPKHAFSGASIGTRVSIGTFTLTILFFQKYPLKVFSNC